MNLLYKMSIKVLAITLLLFSTTVFSQNRNIAVNSFNKVIVSPHIEVTFKTGEKEEVIIEHISEPLEKFHVEVKKHTLQLYLDGAEYTTKKDIEKSSKNRTVPLYKGTVVKVIVVYKKAVSFSLRGEERIVFDSPVNSDRMTLNIYGESQVYMNDVELKDLKITIYGESFFKIEKGTVENQKITAYGESNVNTLDAQSKSTKITAYGDGSFQFNVSDRLKIVSYGEPTVTYKGNARLDSGISIGEVEIVKLN